MTEEPVGYLKLSFLVRWIGIFSSPLFGISFELISLLFVNFSDFRY